MLTDYEIRQIEAMKFERDCLLEEVETQKEIADDLRKNMECWIEKYNKLVDETIRLKTLLSDLLSKSKVITMSNFIEIHEAGERRLINLDWVEEIRCSEDNSCTIYFAFRDPDCDEQDYVMPDEDYLMIKALICGRWQA